MDNSFKPVSYRLTGPQGYRSRLSLGRPSSHISTRSGKIPAFILDLDQTIWDTSDEAKAIEEDIVFRLKPEKGFLTSSDWDRWTKAAADVKPIPEMVDFVRGLQESGIKPVIMTARDEANRGMIQSTLKSYGISADHLMLRGLDDVQQNMTSDVLKRGMMDRTVGQFNFLTMLDDSASNLRAAQGFGVPLVIQPDKAKFDSLTASIERGLQIAEKGGSKRQVQQAVKTLEPILLAGTRSRTATELVKASLASSQVLSVTTASKLAMKAL